MELFLETVSRVSLASIELTMLTEMTSNLQQSLFLCLQSAMILGMESFQN